MPLLTQSRICWDILSVKNGKWREEKRNKFRIIGKRFLSTEKKRLCPCGGAAGVIPRARGSACEEGAEGRDGTGLRVPDARPGHGARDRAAGLSKRPSRSFFGCCSQQEPGAPLLPDGSLGRAGAAAGGRAGPNRRETSCLFAAETARWSPGAPGLVPPAPAPRLSAETAAPPG